MSESLGDCRQNASNLDAPPGVSEHLVDWQGLFFAPAADWPGKFMARARRRFGESPDAESAYNYAIERVSANRWQHLREHFAGKGKPEGFMAITFFNLLEEYARRKYPRPRPPVWVKRLGYKWVRIWQMLCLDRLAPETIIDALGEDNDMLRTEIRNAASQVKSRVRDCGQYVREQTVSGDAENAGTGIAADTTVAPDEATKRQVTLTLLQIMCELLSAGDARTTDAHNTETRPLAEGELRDGQANLGQSLDLTDEERLLLRLVYEEGHKIAAAARALDLPRKKASRMHAAVLRRLRTALSPLGLQGD